MGAAYFYHLTRRPLEAVLPALLERARGAGWRVLVRGADDSGIGRLDEALWTFSEDSFLAHGLAGGPFDAAQPILLSSGPDLPDDIACLMSVGGADVTSREVARLERVCVLFDGTDGGALERARAQWRDLTKSGAAAQYWSEESGRWKKKAESGKGADGGDPVPPRV